MKIQKVLFPEARRLCARLWGKKAGKSKYESVVSLASGIAITKRYLRQIWQTKCTKSDETSSLLPGTARLLPQDLLSRVVCPRRPFSAPYDFYCTYPLATGYESSLT